MVVGLRSPSLAPPQARCCRPLSRADNFNYDWSWGCARRASLHPRLGAAARCRRLTSFNYDWSWGCARRASLHPRLGAAARRRGLTILITIGPGVPLAKPRSTPGYVLPPAVAGSQVLITIGSGVALAKPRCT